MFSINIFDMSVVGQELYADRIMSCHCSRVYVIDPLICFLTTKLDTIIIIIIIAPLTVMILIL